MRSDGRQLDLFPPHRNERLWPYWRAELGREVANAFRYRHARGCTGWSTALSGIDFARWLFRDGQMTRAEFRRHCRFNRRLLRIEAAAA